MRPGGTATLDISLVATGWAYGHRGEPPCHGLFPALPGGINDHGPAMSELVDHTAGLVRRVLPSRVVVCRPKHWAAHQTSAQLLIALHGVVAMVCHDEHIDYHGVDEAEVRECVLGRANIGRTAAAKRHVLGWARSHGWDPESHDVADALVVWYWAVVFGDATVMGGRGAGQPVLAP